MKKKKQFIFFLMMSMLILLIACSDSNVTGEASKIAGFLQEKNQDSGEGITMTCYCDGGEGDCQIKAISDRMTCSSSPVNRCTSSCSSMAHLT